MIPESELTYLEYDGVNQVIEVNDNMPEFSEDELSLEDGSWQSFTELDRLNRVGPAHAMLGVDLFPTEERVGLYIDPTGWKQKKMTSGEMLYNRSHLIGYQFTGENDNWKNLMTGTQYMNQVLMKKYEQEVAAYLKATDHHVRYRITPYFKDNELVARGVQMEAQSIEDNDISFNVFLYNVQEGYTIDYVTGQATKE